MLTIGPQKVAGSFNYFSNLADPSITLAVNMIYSIDLNSDGMEEVIFSGFETQPNLPSTYSNTKIVIFGWDNGIFKNLTSNWLPNETSNVEGVGSLSFGDFNNDGRIDIFSSAYTDMDLSANAYEFINSGNGFIKKNLGSSVGQHDSAAADINGDGFCDVVATGYGEGPRIYLGGPNGLSQQFVKNFMGGSGVALGDFLGNVTVSMILADHSANQARDTALYKFTTEADGNINIEFVSSLPTPRFDLPLYDLPEYGNTNDPWGHSHDIRSIPFDFDSDGLTDVVILSRAAFDGKTWPLYSEIQFLKNSGAGKFSDVTDDILKSYIKESGSSYAPKFGDFNGDGLTDLFLSESSWESTEYNSTTILLQQANETFVDSYRSQLSKLVENYGGKAAIAKGPNGVYYLVTELQVDKGSTTVKFSPLYFDGKINGTDGADLLQGSAADDHISGWDNNDQISGLGGNDTFDGGAGNDIISGGFGNDTIVYLSATASIQVNLTKKLASDLDTNGNSGIGIDKLKSIENIIAGNYDDMLTGNKAANSIIGGSGNDTIDGGPGSDILTGGDGKDIFVFSKKPSLNNIDLIVDFKPGEDIIQLSSLIFSKIKNSIDYLVFGTDSETSNYYLIYDTNTGKLFYDADGNGIIPKIEILEIGIGLNLHSADILII